MFWLEATVEADGCTCPTCHALPASLLFPLQVPSRRGCCISPDFLKLIAACTGLNFLQVLVHIDLRLLTCRAWLVPTFKTVTAETVARNFVA